MLTSGQVRLFLLGIAALLATTACQLLQKGEVGAGAWEMFWTWYVLRLRSSIPLDPWD